MANPSNTELVLQLQGFIAGIGKHYAGQTLQVGGQSIAAATLVTSFQACVDAINAVRPVEAARTAAVAKEQVAIAQAGPLARDFKAVLMAAYKGDATMLADFALKPRKVPVITPEVRAAAAKKAAATRKALGTKGTLQKKAAIKALAAAPAPADAS